MKFAEISERNGNLAKLREIMTKHELWLKNDSEGERAFIQNLKLDDMYLVEYDFSYAVFVKCDLRKSIFSGTNFTGACFDNCNLSLAKFNGANLTRCEFDDSIISKGTDFEDANLLGCRYESTYTETKKYADALRRRKGICLSRDLIGWKKCYVHDKSKKDLFALVKLLIPKGAIVFSINDCKCRTNMVKVLDITSLDEQRHYKTAWSAYTCSFKYTVGETIIEPNFDCAYNVECSSGIHFFRYKASAKSY